MNYELSPEVPHSKTSYDEEAHATPKTCGVSRKLFLVLLLVAAVLVAIGLGVGLGIGLSSGGGSSSPLPSPSPTPPPAGDGPTPSTPGGAPSSSPPPPGLVGDLLLLGPGGGPVPEGGGCTAPADCQLRNSSCIFPWADRVPDTTAGFCVANRVPDAANCTKDEDCYSDRCKEVGGVGGGLLCGLSEGAPCTRAEQCAFLCSRDDRICL